MKWPQHLEYVEAIQHPAFCFSEPGLRQARPICDRFGMPRSASGNFACVFQVQNGGERWAVRCFTRAVPDVRRRYAKLTRHLATARLPSLVDFSYLEEGIRIRGTWYPVVRMAWVDGVALPAYVEVHLGQPEHLRRLACGWEDVARGLRERRIAHGDLQHGNILVTADGQIRLVDYDAMYVPAFRGERSPELGHANWQHPRRSETDYDEDLDAFASLVLSTSFQALATDPSLWERFHNGENLLFARPDFENPRQSTLFGALREHPDRQVRTLARELESRCLGRLGRTRLSLFPARAARNPTPAVRPDAEPAVRPTRDLPAGTTAPVTAPATGESRPWAGAQLLASVAGVILPKLLRAVCASALALLRLAFNAAVASRPPGVEHDARQAPVEPAGAWWRRELPMAAQSPPATPNPWQRLRARMARDRDFALLIWVCIVCGIVDLVLLTRWWLGL